MMFMGSIVNGLTIIGGGLLGSVLAIMLKILSPKVLGLVPSHWAFKWPCRQKVLLLWSSAFALAA